MAKAASEERYPLLLLYVEENGRKSEFPQRVVFAEKGRAQVASYWVTSVALGTAFIFISVLLLMSTFSPLSFPSRPRCVRNVNDNYGNKTIHLVKHGTVWSHRQLDMLRFIADTYPDFEIRNIMLEHSRKNLKKDTNKTVAKPTERKHFHFPNFSSTFVKKLNELLLKDNITEYIQTTTKETQTENADSSEENDVLPLNSNANLTSTNRSKREIFFKLPVSYEDVLKNYPNIKELKTTYKAYFANTPLHYFWVDYSPEMISYSVRVLELWQNGGISFHMPNHDHHGRLIENMQNINKTVPVKQIINITNSIQNYPEKDINISSLKQLIASTKFRYNKLTNDLVSIDGQGFHMATKIPCHSFFGEMIIKLQKDIAYTTVPDFIQRILNVFCGRGAVDSEYCMKNKK